MNNRVKWFAAAAAAAMAAGPASTATGHQWGDYHWYNESGEVTLTLLYKFRDPRWLDYHPGSIAIWRDNDRSPLDLIDGGESASTNSTKCDPITGQIVVCSDNYGGRGWLGIASITASGTHITSATVKYNDTYYSSGTYDTPAQRTFVTCHEVGHTFGLGHLDEAFDNPNLGSCMDYTSDPDGPPDNRYPGQMDWDVLNSSTAYGHFATGGGDTGGGGGGGGPGNGKGPNRLDPFEFRTVGDIPQASSEATTEWGRIIGYDRAGRPNEYLLDLGNGRRKITHVMWIPGHRPAGSR